MRRKPVINLAAEPAAIYHVPVHLRALRPMAIDALAATERSNGSSPWLFRRPGLTLRTRAAGDGSFIVRLTDTTGQVHRFRGTFFDVHPWLRRLVRDCAAAA
jgi:hypothetical protein